MNEQTESEAADAPPAGAVEAKSPNASAPAVDASAPAVGGSAQPAQAKGEGGEKPGGPDAVTNFDPRALLGAALALWLVAMAAFAYQYPGMVADYHLGNLHLAMAQRDEPLRKASIEALIARGPSVVGKMRAELAAKQQPETLPYRLTLLVDVVGKLPGQEATDLVLSCAESAEAPVRANAYKLLGERAKGGGADSTTMLERALDQERDPIARAYAAQALVQAGETGPKVSWTLLSVLRDLPPAARGVAPPLVSALQTSLGVDLPYDPAAQERDEQLEALHAAYVKSGGSYPEDQDFDSWSARRAAATAPTTSESRR